MKKCFFKSVSLLLCCLIAFNGCAIRRDQDNEASSEKDRKESNVTDETGKTKETTVTVATSVSGSANTTAAQSDTEILPENSLYLSSPVTTVEDVPYEYYGQTGLYTGDWKGDRPEGTGLLFIDEYNYYEGEWFNGYIFGEATIQNINEDGVLRYYEGKCACTSLAGEGYMIIAPDPDEDAQIEIYGDFNDESSLEYFSYDADRFLVDYGYVLNGDLMSYFDYACYYPLDKSYTTEMSCGLYTEDNYNYRKNFNGYYFGHINDNGKPQGTGIFLVDGKEFQRETLIDNTKLNLTFKLSIVILGNWDNGNISGSYVTYETTRPVDDQYYDQAHEDRKEYYYCDQSGLYRKDYYLDKFWYTDNGVVDMFQTNVQYYKDYELGSDGVYRAGLNTTETYFRQDYADANSAYTAGSLGRKEICPCYVLDKSNNRSNFYEGYRAVYDPEGNMLEYTEYTKQVPDGKDVSNDQWKSIGTAIVTAGIVFAGCYLGYKLLTSTPSGSATRKTNEYNQNTKYDFSEENEYRAKKEEAEQLRKKAADLEASLYTWTYTEAEVYDIKKQIEALYFEANRIDPSLI